LLALSSIVDLEITRIEQADEVVLSCAGRLDAETGDELARAVAEELRRGHLAVRLDLRRLTPILIETAAAVSRPSSRKAAAEPSNVTHGPEG
jgi:hypothetical protein